MNQTEFHNLLVKITPRAIAKAKALTRAESRRRNLIESGAIFTTSTTF